LIAPRSKEFLKRLQPNLPGISPALPKSSTIVPSYQASHKIPEEAQFSNSFFNIFDKNAYVPALHACALLLSNCHTVAYFQRFLAAGQNNRSFLHYEDPAVSA